MSHRYKIKNQRGVYFVTLRVSGWIDIFSRQRYRDIILESLQYCRKEKGLCIHGYVVMTNHLHLVLSASGKQTLSEVIGDFKSFTAKEVLRSIQSKPESRRKWLLSLFKDFAKKKERNQIHQFWNSDNHPIVLYSNKVLTQKLDYIHRNPVKAGWVQVPQHYIYSSASNYFEDGKGVFEVDLLEAYFSSDRL